MTIIETITIGNAVLTSIALTVTYLNYYHSRRKDFQDKLFQIKLDAYKVLNGKCYDAFVGLNINSSPFNQIYEIGTEEDWSTYFDRDITKMYKIGFELQDVIYSYAYLLPTNIIEKYYDFSNLCLGFVTMSAHYDTELIINNSDRMWVSYTELVNFIRLDLNIESIDKGLLKRVTSPMF